MKKSVSIQHIQNILTQDVYNKLRYFIKLEWDNNMGSIHILTKKEKLFDTVLEASNNRTSYYKKTFKIKQIIIMEKINKNPHIKIKL